mmetsp:Transcript_64448/g.158610  ORF Transcript_64448/g.158610 Transcript_64448/m.158610 type:complete len:567 (+) Transcript_64448:56-1756(+)
MRCRLASRHFLGITLALSVASPSRAFAVPSLRSFFRRSCPASSQGATKRWMCSSAPASTDVLSTYNELAAKLKKTAALEGAMGLLGWDEQTMMPTGAEEARGQQKAVLAGVLHESKTDPAVGQLLKKLDPSSSDLDPYQAATVRIAKERYEQNVRMSSELASKAAELTSKAYGAWTRARAEADFKGFAPLLAEVFELTREINAVTKPDLPVYDAAIDSFDPKMKSERITEIFDEVKSHLTPLIAEIAAKVEADPSLHEVPKALQGGVDWDPTKQAEMCKEIAEAIGFDFKRGRMDVSVHPFTGGSHMTDVRITTRYSSDNWIEGVAGTIHECGHAMYEQGRPKAYSDLPVSESLGMATHESQSLLWERMVGQSLPFWKWATPIVHKYFPHTKDVTAEQFYRFHNIVKPSLIRVDADEVTYPLHVILRFEIERGVLDGSTKVEDLPELWDSKMKEYLGVVPPSTKEGVLQDVHWPSGAIGYFPSYTLGAMMATQIYEAAQHEIPDLDAKIEEGNFLELRDWLNKRVHAQGSRHESADDLLEEVTGKRLDPTVFVSYLKNKYSAIYGL